MGIVSGDNSWSYPLTIKGKVLRRFFRRVMREIQIFYFLDILVREGGGFHYWIPLAVGKLESVFVKINIV